MKNFFRRKVSIFGKAIPISVILLLIVTVGAVAAFLLSMSFDVNLTASSGPSGTWGAVSCVKTGGEGTFDTCEFSAGKVNVAISGADNSFQGRIIQLYQGPGAQTLLFDDGTPDTLVVTCEVDWPAWEHPESCNGAVLGNEPQEMRIYISGSALVPNEVVPEFSPLLTISDN